MNNNVVNIGSSLKWRSVYDNKKRYYKENVVTMYGSVFRCKVHSSIGKEPIVVKDSFGHISFANLDTWDVIVDMLYYYNYYLDCNRNDVCRTDSLTEYNVSVLHPTGGINGTDVYELSTAIQMIPLVHRNKRGLKCTFVNKMNEIETWLWNGGVFDDITTWKECYITAMKVVDETLFANGK